MEAPLVKYSSPVGPNDTPCPYARDTEGRYYLLAAGVILDPHRVLPSPPSSLPSSPSSLPSSPSSSPPLNTPALKHGYLCITDSECTSEKAAELYRSIIAAPFPLEMMALTCVQFESCPVGLNPNRIVLGPLSVIVDDENPYDRYYASLQNHRLSLSDAFGAGGDDGGDDGGDGKLCSVLDKTGETYSISFLVDTNEQWVRSYLKKHPQKLVHPDGRTIQLTSELYIKLATVYLKRIGARALPVTVVHAREQPSMPGIVNLPPTDQSSTNQSSAP